MLFKITRYKKKMKLLGLKKQYLLNLKDLEVVVYDNFPILGKSKR